MTHPKASSARVQTALLRLGAVLTAGAVIYCAFIQRLTVATGLFHATVAVIAIALALEFTTPRGQVLGRVIGQALLLAWLVPLYRLQGNVEGRWLLSALVFFALYFGLFFLLTHAKKRPDAARHVVFLIGGVIITCVSIDLFHMGRAPLQPIRPPAYHPYLTYPVRDSYAYNHARERLVRDNRGVSFSQEKGATERIILAGASTMWCQGLELDDSISRVLHSALEKRYPARRFEVITVAYAGKYQVNELIDSVVTIPHWDADLVISMNGFNEVWYGEDENYYEGMPYIEGQMYATGTVPVLLARFSHFGAVLYNRRVSQFTRRSPYALREESRYEPPRYFAYLRRTARSHAQSNTPYVYSFCPNVAERTWRTREESEIMEQAGDWTGIVAQRRQLAHQIVEQEGQIVYDSMSLLAPVETAVFLDECHLTAEAVRRLCDDLAQRIPGWIDKWRPAVKHPGGS